MTGRDGFMKKKNHETFVIKRDANGYFPPDNESTNSFLDYIKDMEISFYNYFKEDLEKIHQVLKEKELIMSGFYRLKDEKNHELSKLIVEHLGFNLILDVEFRR